MSPDATAIGTANDRPDDTNAPKTPQGSVRQPTPEPQNLTYRERRHVATLLRRLAHLEERARKHRGNPSWDRAEAAALRWIIDRAGLTEPA
jgi:hypothetical protein